MTAIPSPQPNCLADETIAVVALAAGMSPAGAEAVARIDQVMAQIRRGMAKRDFGRRIISQIAPNLDVAHMDVLGVIGRVWVDAAAPAEEITVGLVAERLAIDPSRASRLVAEMVEQGFARRVASQSDARRIGLELTEAGRQFMLAVRDAKWRVFSASLAAWEEGELVEFARLLGKFSVWTASADPGT